jgi:hypothetical protein
VKTAVVAVVLAVAFPVFGQEHPEHPKNKEEAKQEHPAAKKAEHAYSMDELSAAIQGDIEAAQKKGGGWYRLKDKAGKKTWQLKLDHVHKERLSKLDDKTYFACTDFKSSDGHLLDVDFFMKDNGKKLVMTDATVHKIDGKPRYSWEEKNGYWVRVPVGK